MENTEFKITPCEITYKGKPLPIGKPISAWVELFGKDYSRNFHEHTYIWDDLGVAIDNGMITSDMKNVNDYEHRKHDNVYIFFANLDSPAGQEGLLYKASDYHVIDVEKYTSVDPDFPDVKPFTMEEVKKLQEKYHPRNYIYPYKTYDKIIDVEGAPIQKGMTLKQLNKERRKVGLPIFSYWDLNMNMIDEDGHTKGNKGSYHDETYSTKSCKDRAESVTYFVSVRYTDDYQPEYLEITTEVSFGR